SQIKNRKSKIPAGLPTRCARVRVSSSDAKGKSKVQREARGRRGGARRAHVRPGEGARADAAKGREAARGEAALGRGVARASPGEGVGGRGGGRLRAREAEGVRLPRRRALRIWFRVLSCQAEARRSSAARARPQNEEGLEGDRRRRTRTRLSGDARRGTH